MSRREVDFAMGILGERVRARSRARERVASGPTEQPGPEAQLTSAEKEFLKAREQQMVSGGNAKEYVRSWKTS